MTDPILLLTIPAMAWLDRQRGSPKAVEKIPKAAALAGLGICVAAIVTPIHVWQALVVVAGTWAAYSVGFGAPIGAAITGRMQPPLEVWQVGFLRRNAWAALMVRGLMHAVPGLLIGSPNTALALAVAFGVAFPLAPWVATRMLRRAGNDAWAAQEYLRGGFAGLLLWLMTWL